jgi:uncharacterized DUF497 family protein
MDLPERLDIPEYEFRLVLGRTKIEYDKNKDSRNVDKRGYSFEVVAGFLERRMLPVQQPPFMTSDAFLENDEVRHMHMTVDDSGYVVFFVTTMRNDEAVRVISFRRASAKEREEFCTHTGFRK